MKLPHERNRAFGALQRQVHRGAFAGPALLIASEQGKCYRPW